jgi:hypothetical protein
MMPQPALDRRSLLKLGGGLSAALLAGTNFPAIAASAMQNRDAGRFTTLDAGTARTLEAMAARIIPTTHTPGAREAGAVWFMDALLGSDLADDMALIISGTADLDAQANGAFADLPSAAQDRLLSTIEDGDFFNAVRFMTIAGTFTLSEYGGNRGNVGWQMLGLTNQHHWQPPFGYYDRDRHGEQEA